MQSRRVARGLLSSASSNLGEVDELLRLPWLSWWPPIPDSGSFSHMLWRTLVSKAGSGPVLPGSSPRVEPEVTHAAETKQQKPTREYQTGMKAPQLRKEMVGLYGYEILKSAKGFRIFAQDAIDK